MYQVSWLANLPHSVRVYLSKLSIKLIEHFSVFVFVPHSETILDLIVAIDSALEVNSVHCQAALFIHNK